MELLSGWKEIADYLQLTVRTAQRWETVGLPVRRAYESERSPVLAAREELERWLNTRQTRVRTHTSATQLALALKGKELQNARRRIRRQTRILLNQVTHLGNDQQRLIRLIKESLTSTAHSAGAARH